MQDFPLAAEESFLVLSIRYDERRNAHTMYPYVRLVSSEPGRYGWGYGQSAIPYELGELEVSAGYHDSMNIYSIKMSCEKEIKSE